MTTTSANIAGVIRPLGGVLRRVGPGRILDIDEIQPTAGKKRTAVNGMFELFFVDGKVVLEKKAERKCVVNGREGVWRTIMGRPRFIPDGHRLDFKTGTTVPSGGHDA